MGKYKKIIGIVSVGFIILITYRIIFYFIQIAGGDYFSLSSMQLDYWRLFPFFVWDPKVGMGWSIIPLVSSQPYSWFIGWIGGLVGDNGVLIERLVWWIPFLAISFISSFLLSKKLLKHSLFSYIVPFFYLCNTYILLIVGGGQIAGIGFAYAFAPLVILSYILLLERTTLNRAILTGLALSVSVMLDLRMTYVTLVGIGIFMLIKFTFQLRDVNERLKNLFKNLLYIFLIPGLVSTLLHAFWLIPMAIVRQNPLNQLGSAYNSLAAVTYFSFGTFEQAFGLLHPNWPENIFGKVGFMKPEFLLLPLLAYSSLFFIKKGKKTEEEKKETLYVLYFALLGIIGVFLAKGANDPFGGIYLWMFSHVPGFIMFRDPTKWYLLIALSYSLLIPYAVGKIYEFLKRRLV